MTTLEQIEALNLKAEKAGEEAQEIYKQQYQYKTDAFNLAVQYVLAEKLLSKCKWTAVLRGYNTGLTLNGDTTDLNEVTRDLLFRGWYHDSLELKPGIKLCFDDGDVIISFKDEGQIKPFLTEQEIKIDISKLVQMKSKLEKELQIVNEIINTVQ